MILTKTPLRIPLAGGGTDLPIFTSKKNVGIVIPIAINQYIYTYLIKRPINASTLVQTGDLQEVKMNQNIRHNLIRETLKYFNIKKQIHLGFFSTMPTRSGIGSSSSLVVGLVASICKFKKLNYSKRKISEAAITIERKILKEKGGIQDHISASYGGINFIKCFQNYKFKVKKINFDNSQIKFLENHLILIFTNIKRYSSNIIRTQSKKVSIKNYLEVRNEVKKIIETIKKESAKDLGKIFSNHWERKKKLSLKMSNSKIDRIYKKILKNKYFHGGKLIGGGGGGFFLFVTSNNQKAENYLKKNNFIFSEIKVDMKGSRLVKIS